MKKILILSEGTKTSGPTTWKNLLVINLKNSDFVVNEINVATISSMKDLFKIINTDIVHTYHISGLTVIFLLIAKVLNKKIIFTLHGNFYSEEKSKKGVKKLFWIYLHKISLNLAGLITFPSNYLHKQIIKQDPKLTKKSIIIYNGISDRTKPNDKKFDKRNPSLLAITNFNIIQKAEGVTPLIKAVNKMSQDIPGINLTIVGGGKYLDQYKEQYQCSTVRFIGKSGNTNALLEECDIFVHSTFLDNLPYVILEALSHEKPIISVRIGGIPEILPAEALASPRADDIYNKIKETITSSSFRKRLIDYNKNNKSKFMISNIIKQFIYIYET